MKKIIVLIMIMLILGSIPVASAFDLTKWIKDVLRYLKLMSTYFIYPNDPGMGYCDFPGRYEVFIETGASTHEVYDHCVDCGCSSGLDTFYWSCTQIANAIMNGEVIVVSGSEAGIRACVGDNIWFNYIIYQPPTTTTTTTTMPPLTTTSPVTTLPTKCYSNSDCFWCGDTCILKTGEPLICATVMPLEGALCVCKDYSCQTIYQPVPPTNPLELILYNIVMWLCNTFGWFCP